VASRLALYQHVVVAGVVPSEELRALLLRLYAVSEALEMEAMEEMFSAAPHLLVAGTDPDDRQGRHSLWHPRPPGHLGARCERNFSANGADS
jgi:hypothetical protein